MYHEYFPESIIQLQQEIRNHPPLLKQMSELPDDADLSDKVGLIAAYCGIVLDGYYDQDNIEELAEKMVFELRRARRELVEDILKPIPSSNT